MKNGETDRQTGRRRERERELGFHFQKNKKPSGVRPEVCAVYMALKVQLLSITVLTQMERVLHKAREVICFALSNAFSIRFPPFQSSPPY